MNRIYKSIGANSRAKAKKGSSLEQGEMGISKRGDNWEIDESRALLDACEEVQLLTHKRDLNFKATQWTQIYELFKEKDRKSRTKEQVVNRIKTMRREFGNFRELANKSGWSWNYDLHKPIPPDDNTWEELLKVDKQRWQYYHKKTCPWYERMLAMCGGKMANGNASYDAFGTANSATGSETGSSDVPETPVHDDWAAPHFDFEPFCSLRDPTVEQPMSQEIPLTTDTMRVSQASRDSGSGKRKSTDEGSNMSKGKKIQRRISEKAKIIQEIAGRGAQMVKLNEQLVEEVGRVAKLKEDKYRRKEEKEEEKNRRKEEEKEEKKKEHEYLMNKLNSLQLDSGLYHVIRQKLMKDPHEREYFLQASDQEIVDWVNYIRTQQYPSYGMNPQGGMHQQGGMNPLGGTFFMNPSMYDPIGFFNSGYRPPQQ